MMDEKVMNLFGEILENQTELSSRVKNIETKVEHDLGYKIKALFDAREVQNDKNDTIINALERIEAKVEVLQMETAHVRKVR